MPTESFLTSFAAVTESRPNSTALWWNDRPVTYRELSELAAAAHPLLPPNSAGDAGPVCVIGKKSPELVGTLLALFQAGHRVLLPPSDLGPATLRQLTAQAGCRALISVEAGGQPLVAPLPTDAPAADRAETEPAGPEAGRPETRGAQPVRAEAGRGPAGPGLLLTTSGSTGVPKIVPLATAGVDRFIGWAAERFDIGPDAVVLNYAPLNFDLCLLDVWTSLARGAAVALVAEDSATNGGLLLHLMARSTVVQGVPMLFRLATDAAGEGTRVLAGVRHVLVTGDVMPADVLQRTRRLAPAAALYNLYGCTETNDSFLHRIDGPLADEAPTAPLPIGRPIAGVTAAVLAADGTPLIGPGSGELLVSTPFQTAGYLDPRLDAGRFGPAPAGLPAGRYYRTGDLVRRDDAGLLTLIGRADFHVKVRGVRINTQEIETVIAQHADVLEAAVLAIPDEVAGHRLHAVIRRHPGTTLNGLQLRAHCAARLARTAIPGRVEIVDNALPRTSTGKVDRKQLRLSREGGN
jgi:acyl-coenzyme A synthetase/AMP-(fatty) acid ligase